MPKDINSIASENGFKVVSSNHLSEIDGDAIELEHIKSKAKLLYLRNDDEDKAFSISFKTPAADDTGVFHILEHSVLCGSEKFPVKEPFVNLLKSSMQTFLNAMTFPDKTMYPVSSTNEQDLINLMDVYMDAVFNPNIYKNRMIFEQEGWHIEPSGDETNPGALEYNGVVFNEMKGALSDAESVLYDTLSASLFPDTTYRFESGGVPTSIPDLTYEAFLDNHKRHYRPDNSFIVLYGNMNPERFLGFLNSEYLSKFDYSSLGKLEINPLELQLPVKQMDVVKEMDTTPDNSCMALGFVIDKATNVEKIIATDILIDAIMGSNEAPLKRVLLDSDIADDCKGYIADSVLQPFSVIQIKGMKDDAHVQFPSLVHETILKLASGELDMKLVEAALSHAEFVMREHNFGYPDGVILSMSAMSGWLYSDGAALDYIRYEDIYTSLRQKLDTNYFYDLLREVFIDNSHMASARIAPVDYSENPMQVVLQERLDKLSESDREAARVNSKELKEAQAAPDRPEDISKLPKLDLSDIGEAPAEPEFHLVDEASMKTLYHELETHGIVYVTRYFDISCVAFEDMPYVSLLAKVLGKLDCENITAADLDTLVQSKLGNLNFGVEVYEDPNIRDRVIPKFAVSASALAENVRYIASIEKEIIQTSLFDDFDRLHDILLQRKVAFEQAFAMAGHSVATSRAATYHLPAAVLKDELSGINCYLFIKDLLNNFDTKKEEIADKLRHLTGKIFNDDNCLLSFAGKRECYIELMDAGFTLGTSGEGECQTLEIPKPKPRREAFIVPTDISYTALSANRKDVESVFDGKWSVLARILSYDYLWNEVRVLGGAYGCGFNSALAGLSSFYSYRDPHIDETVERFKSAGKWLSNFSPSDEEYVGYIVSTVAGIDNPLKPRDLIRRQDVMHITGYSPEDRLKTREDVLSTRISDIRKLGEAVSKFADEDHLCTVGSKDLVKDSSLDFEVIELC